MCSSELDPKILAVLSDATARKNNPFLSWLAAVTTSDGQTLVRDIDISKVFLLYTCPGEIDGTPCDEIVFSSVADLEFSGTPIVGNHGCNSEGDEMISTGKAYFNIDMATTIKELPEEIL